MTSPQRLKFSLECVSQLCALIVLAGIQGLAQDESRFRDIAYVNRTPHPVDLDRVNYNIATDNITKSIWLQSVGDTV